MKLKSDCVVTSIADDVVIVPTDNDSFHGIVRGNKTLADIAELLRNDITAEDIAAALHERYDAPDGVIESSVSHAISELRRLNMLEE